MLDKIKSRLDDYLEFDSDKLFTPKGDLVKIFGGAIRDSISGDPIHDVDILVGSESYNTCLKKILLKNGYKYFDNLLPKDLSSIYTDIKIINEPHTYMKGDKIIQIIRPVPKPSRQLSIYDRPIATELDYIGSFNSLIKEVDISCCGVSYDGRELYENVKDSILHCLNKVFIVNSKSKMYTEKRVYHRITKLEARGWREIKNDIGIRRNLVLNNFI
jgi:hypothetical protein